MSDLPDPDTVQLLELRRQAQMKLETFFPAVIDIPDISATGVKCAGGTVREVGAQLMRGGLLVEYDLAFRVRRELLSAKPEIGARLTFDGEDKRIMRVIDPSNDVAYVLACDSVEK